MSDALRSKLSETNKYYISRQRYYELKHFCLQYPEWKKDVLNFSGYASNSKHESVKIPGENFVEKNAIKLAESSSKMEMISRSAMLADPSISKWIIAAVTNGYSYVYLQMHMNIPCGKDMYYDRYRKFFWILDKERG